jgi:hypothetical protein
MKNPPDGGFSDGHSSESVLLLLIGHRYPGLTGVIAHGTLAQTCDEDTEPNQSSENYHQVRLASPHSASSCIS